MSSEKLILLAIAMGTIGLVLLLGYKLDKYEENGNKKDKKTKKQSDNEYKIKKEIDFEFLKKDYKNNLNQVAALNNLDKINFRNTRYNEEFDKTSIIEKVNLSKIETFSEENINEKSAIESNIDVNEDLEDDNIYYYENDNDSTMIFDSIIVNEENVKSYELEIENKKPKTTLEDMDKLTQKSKLEVTSKTNNSIKNKSKKINI